MTDQEFNELGIDKDAKINSNNFIHIRFILKSILSFDKILDHPVKS